MSPVNARRARPGVTVVECALIYPITFLLVLGLVIGALGIFRYQEVASLARAGARYASTHGAQFRKDTGLSVGSGGTQVGQVNNIWWYQASPTSASGSDTSWTGTIYDQSIRPNIAILNPNQLKCQVGWPPVINQPNNPDNWPGSQVTVTVTYQWLPEAFFVGPITLTSTSSMPITN